MSEYITPDFNVDAFNCPLCMAFAHQKWFTKIDASTDGHVIPVRELSLAYCAKCRVPSIWRQRRMIYPANSCAPSAAEDLPKDIKLDFDEAKEIVSKSARSSAAILRLAIQKLCRHLGQPGKKLDDDIAQLVKQGLPQKIQQALEVVRVIGVHAVPPGEIDICDDQPLL